MNQHPEANARLAWDRQWTSPSLDKKTLPLNGGPSILGSGRIRELPLNICLSTPVNSTFNELLYRAVHRQTIQMQLTEILERLRCLSNPDAVAGMARFGINPERSYGVSMPTLRNVAKEIGKDHTLAEQLWSSGIHDARILGCLIDDPELVTEDQLERWVRDFNSWDVCDQCCGNLFDKTEWAYMKAMEWSQREEEFVKRAGFVMMASLAIHDKKADDAQFEQFFPIIRREATDEKNFVTKAVNWALRQIGKRNRLLNEGAIAVARDIQRIKSRSARWIAAGALRELTSEKVRGKWTQGLASDTFSQTERGY
jgi:3-methyladenine DNA glycosylase AlkD